MPGHFRGYIAIENGFMELTEYRRKRNFSRTKEPSGKLPQRRRSVKRGALRFVIQKHAASHLHYDFRLELDGVLKSWAVPKGPDLNPKTKRLAMHVEDHPIEYGEFEGIIPQGEYGGGTVMVWDRGTWEPREDPGQGYRDGKLKFVLKGEKLRGGWMLVRRVGRNAEDDARAWFLFKERDRFADTTRSVTEWLPLSVATGRDLKDIAEQADHVWSNQGKVKKQRTSITSGAIKAASQTTRTMGSRPRESQGELSLLNADVVRVLSAVRLTHPEKVLYPEDGLTKRDLAEYYARVAEWMLPWVKGRPLSLMRCPAGNGKPCFFQKHPGVATFEHLTPVNVSETGTADYNLSVRDAKGLVELVQMGVLEIHTWGSRMRNLEKPIWLVLDLDPDPAVKWPEVVRAAQEVKLLLNELDLVVYLKTTGGKGLHLVIPIQARTPWDQAKAFCKGIAEVMVRVAPDKYVATMSKASRKGKIFIDYLRNGRGATAIAPFSTRARRGAPVSVPIAWDELSPQLTSDHFTVRNVVERLETLRRDPWAELLTTKQSLTKSMFKRLGL
jgi:bifunctional non-homologous end joining protein LigD